MTDTEKFEGFKAYYDKIVSGCAEFLRDAINIYCD
jgi:hypothetical protein